MNCIKKIRIKIDEIDDGDIWYLEEGNCFQNQVNSICKIDIQKKHRAETGLQKQFHRIASQNC